MSELKILNMPSPQILERLRREEEEGSRFLLATTSLTTAGKQGKQIFPSILRRPWRSLQGSFSKWSFPFQIFLLRCSFDESHRQPIFLLGGIPALAELIQVNEKTLFRWQKKKHVMWSKLSKRHQWSKDDDLKLSNAYGRIMHWQGDRWKITIIITNGNTITNIIINTSTTIAESESGR